MNELIDNLINGNMREAKRMAKRYSGWTIYKTLRFDYGYSDKKAELTADWLKGRDCWQAACDAQ